jgi:hypothetical protein
MKNPLIAEHLTLYSHRVADFTNIIIKDQQELLKASPMADPVEIARAILELETIWVKLDELRETIISLRQ